MLDYSMFVIDVETTSIDIVTGDIIEISITRMKDDIQKTWFLKPLGIEYEPSALKINGHKIEDLRHETEYGRRTYQDPHKVIIEIENWLMEDDMPAENRCIVGYNVAFDLTRLEQLWTKCNSRDSYPFGRRYLDPMIIEFFMNYCNGIEEGYSLSNTLKKYGIKNLKAHSASADTTATKELFIKQIEHFKKLK